MKNYKIVLTGGPCAGKTTAKENIVQEFTEMGFKVFVVNETATELINGNIRPFGDDPIEIEQFQRFILKMQLEKEKIYDEAAKLSNLDTIIICDRGIFDNRAYISNKIFKKMLKELSLDELEVLNQYDLVLHLVTAAKGAEEFYTTENNTARTETVDEAKELDLKTLNAWVGHENLKIVKNEGTFDEKIKNVLKEIYELVNVPYPIQKQSKYLVKEVDLDKLNDYYLVKLDIEQFFIGTNPADNTMVRKTIIDGSEFYRVTRKRDTDKVGERITTSRSISEREYLELKSRSLEIPIIKSRYCFTDGDCCFKLDIFEGGKLVILESDLTKEKAKVKIPKFIKIEKDITDVITYRNMSLYHEINTPMKNKKK